MGFVLRGTRGGEQSRERGLRRLLGKSGLLFEGWQVYRVEFEQRRTYGSVVKI